MYTRREINLMVAVLVMCMYIIVITHVCRETVVCCNDLQGDPVGKLAME